jgi:hypothetical protein
MDDPRSIPELSNYGDKMGAMILRDQFDSTQGIKPEQILYKPNR